MAPSTGCNPVIAAAAGSIKAFSTIRVKVSSRNAATMPEGALAVPSTVSAWGAGSLGALDEEELPPQPLIAASMAITVMR